MNADPVATDAQNTLIAHVFDDARKGFRFDRQARRDILFGGDRFCNDTGFYA